MFKRRMKRWIAGILVFIMVMGQSSPIINAMINEDNIVRGYNPFIEYLIDKEDGRFVIRTLEGVPQKTSDDYQKLMFERDNDPETSYTTFRVDGEDYIYGNSYAGKSYGSKNHYTTGDGDGMLSVSEWDFDGLNIKQALEIIEDPEHPNVGNVRIRYEVTNTSSVNRTVGNRIMLDTQLGGNDGSSFVVGQDTIRYETALTGNQIPDFFRTSDNEIAPNVIGYGFIRGWGQEAPDKVVFAHYNTLADNKWDAPLDGTLNFTTDENAYEGADSAVAYYFSEKPLSPGESRTFETFYGIGDFSHYNSDSTYNVMLSAPEQLSVNGTKTGYVENPVTVTVTIDNSMENSMNMTGVVINLVKQDARFKDVVGEDYTLLVPLIEKGEVKSYDFLLEPVNQQDYISEPIKVAVTSDNSETAQSAYDYILMPNISGALPELTIDAISPDTVYYNGYREFSMTGKGFSMLNNKGLWELYLIAPDGNALEISDENVSIVSNEQLNIVLYDDTLSAPTPAGEYVLKLVHSELGTITTPQSKAIGFSEDIQYKSRKYGVLYVERSSSDVYNIGIADSSEALETIKETKDIVLDIVGDVVEFTDDANNHIYKVKTDQQDAVINSVIKYTDSDVPLEIKKTGDLITINGDGTLQIVGSNEFWWWGFYTYIADGVDYNIEEVLIEDEEEDALFEINPEWSENDDSDEEQSNIVIDFFNPINAIGAAVNTYYDGFNINIKSVVLLDEGASFGGSMSVEIPFGQEVPVVEEEEDLSEDEMDDAIGEALQDLFMTNEERQQKYEQREKNDARTNMSIKLRALLLSDDGLSSKIESLITTSDATPPQKAQLILEMVLSSPEILMSAYDLIKGKGDDGGDTKSVGVSIDVKKVVFGKKYGEDFMYDNVRYIGLEAEGEIMVTLPFGSEEDREEAQGVRAYASFDTIEGAYTFEADVDLELAEAHAIVSIVKVGGELKPDHIELSGGFSPGVPITPPVFISKIGGGVKNLQSKSDDEPLTIILILGLDVVPAMEGDFRAEVSKSGFSLQGEFELKGGMKIFKEAYIALHWDHPVYMACGATVDLFDVIQGSASLYIGEIPVQGGGYKFYFEGKVKVSITIPKKVWFVGGKSIGGAELGVSTEKIWGSVEIIGIGVGITYVYGEGVRFSDGDNDLALSNLTDVTIPENAIYNGSIMDENGNVTEGQFIVGGNIRKVGDSNSAFVSEGLDLSQLYVVANVDNTSYDFLIAGEDNALFELQYTGNMPKLTLTGPNGMMIDLVEDVNYMVKTLDAEDSPSGETMNHIYISVTNPENGTYTVTSDSPLEVGTMYEAKSMPELKGLDYVVSGETMNVTYQATNAEDALVSLFMVHEDGTEYAVGSNLDATLGAATINMPASLPEGTYTLRASIAHPSYGFDDIMSETTYTVVDSYKPAMVTDIHTSYVGNGIMSASWNHLDKGDDIKYYVTVYDTNGLAVDGYKDMVSLDTTIIFGGSYTGIDPDGNELQYDMPVNNDYTIGVTAVRIRTHVDGNVTRHLSTEISSDRFTKRQPEPPSLMVSFLDDYTFTGDDYYFDEGDITIGFESNQTVDTAVYVDGDYYGTYNDKHAIDLPLELDNGKHSVRFVSANSMNDEASTEIVFIVDTQAPDLRIDSPSTSIVSNTGVVSVKGNVEGGALLYMNNERVDVDGDGNFDTSFIMDMDRLTDKLVLKAIDVAGNETVYNSDIVNGSLAPIETIVIDDNDSEGRTGQSSLLRVRAIDSNGKQVLMDNEDLTFRVIKGSSLGRVDQEGIVSFFDAGNMAVMASYALTDSYVLTDAIEFDVESAIDMLEIVPEIQSLRVKETVELGVVGQSKYSETKLDNNNVSYYILEGSNLVTLIGNKLTATSTGEVIVGADYNKDGVSLSTTLHFTVYGESSQEKESTNYQEKESTNYQEATVIDAIDTVLNGVWQNLLEREKDLQITSVREIRNDIDTKISMLDVGSLIVDSGTVGSDDIFLAGIVLNGSDLVDENQFKMDGDVYELTFKNAGGQLNKKIALSLVCRAGTDELSKYGIYVYNEIFGKWQFVSDEIDDGQLVARLEHLSKYAVLEPIETHGFMDIENNWARRMILSLQSLGVVNGTVSGGYNYYSPNKEVTRLELAAMAVRVYEAINGNSSETYEHVQFMDDTSIPPWGKVYAQKAYNYGLLKGVEKGGDIYFNPQDLATRAETMTILSRAIGGTPTVTQNFADNGAIPKWASDHIQNLVELGLVNGYEDGTIRPQNNITRAEIAKLLYYWIDHEVVSVE